MLSHCSYVLSTQRIR